MTKEAQNSTSNNTTAATKATKWFKSLFDGISSIVILAFAIVGAAQQIKNGTTEIRVGIACVVVGVLAARLLERLFENR